MIPFHSSLRVTAALLLLAGCNAQETEEPALRITTVAAESTDALVADNLALGLTSRDAAGAVIPGLAQSWRVSDDGLSIVFRLRDAQFADGRAVTAGDVTASIASARMRGSPLVMSLLAGVASVSAPLADVVEIALTTPQPEFLELLAHPDLAIAPGGRGPIRAGAFLVSEGDAPADRQASDPPAILLVRSDSFHDAASVLVGAADIRTTNAEAAIAAFRNSVADIVTGGELDGIGSARIVGSSDALRLEAVRAVYTLLVNQSQGPLADRRIRTAMAMAIDRDRIGPQLFGTAAAAAVAGVAPPMSRGVQPASLPDWQSLSLVQRREESLRLMAEAGHDADNRLSLTVSATSRPADELILTLVASDLAAIGVDLTLGRRNSSAHDAAVARGDFDLALVRRTSPIDSPLPFLDPLRCDRNQHGSCLKEADALLVRSWTATSPSERAALLASAERLWAEDAAAIGIIQPVAWSLVSRRVSGWTPNASGVHLLRFLSVTPERRLLK